MNEFGGYIEAESHRAILFWGHYWDNPQWLPKSQIEQRNPWDCTETLVKVKDWLCKSNDLDEFRRHSNG